MKIERILLINPTVDSIEMRDGWSKGSSMQPHGLCCLSSYLRMHGYEVRVLDMLVDLFQPGEVRELVLDWKPEVVGISTYTPSLNTSLSICRFVKKIDPHIITILGGPHVTFMPQEALTKEQAVDFVVMGEGESTLIELLEALRFPGGVALEAIDGLAYRAGGAQSEEGRARIRVNPPRERLSCLDLLPFSDRWGLPLQAYTAPYTLISSRGCPGRCIFCAAGALSGSRQRMRSVENVFAEVYYLSEVFKAAYLLISDDTFTVSHERVTRFCDMMIAADVRLEWWCESRVQAMTREVLEKMARAGCGSIQFGVESGSQQVLSDIRKQMSLDKLREVLRAACELNIRPICSLMLGHYSDTPETMQQTIDLARELKEEYGAAVLISINTLFPGTYQYEHREELGLHLYSEDWRDFDLGNINVYTDHFDRNTLAKYYFAAQSFTASREEVENVFRKRRWKGPQQQETVVSQAS